MHTEIKVILGITLLTLLSLGATYLLFGKLESRADGESSVGAGRIKYGGAIGGFVVIYGLLSVSARALYDVSDLFRPSAELTEISIGDSWDMLSTVGDNVQRVGSATIAQEPGSKFISVSGRIVNSVADINSPDVTFASLAGQIVGQSIYFIYNNSKDEQGVARGDLDNLSPDTIVLTFTDLHNKDKDGIPIGQIRLTRIQKDG